MFTRFGFSCALFGVLFLAAASRAEVKRVLGPAKPIGEGKIWTWAEVDANGALLNVGVSMSKGALRGLPTTGGEACCGGHEYSLPMPAGVVSPFTHAVVNWNPKGHEPAGIYDKPHFDFHFYTITEAQRMNIKESAESDKAGSLPPSSDCLPKNYVQAPGIVGRMGAHWVDTTAPEFNGQPFTHTFIYGSYNGKVSFVEPMITMAQLESRVNVVAPIPQPITPFDAKFSPNVYSIWHDITNGEISVSLRSVKSN